MNHSLRLMMAAFFLCPSLAHAAARPAVVLSTDCGTEVDDQWALAHLAMSPELELRGVVTTHAPNFAAPAAESSAQAARAMLALLPIEPKPPVFAGSSTPLEAKDRPRPSAGLDFLVHEARNHTADDRLVVVMIGAATDVASALLLDPAIADRIRIVSMAFNGWPEGTDPWNVKNDIKAWQVVLASKVPLVVGDAAVTKRRLSMTVRKDHSLLDGHGKAADELVANLERWLAKNGQMAESVAGAPGTWPIWDEVTTAYLLGLAHVRTYLRPALRDDMTFDHSQPHGTLDWVTEIAGERLWADLVRKLDKRPSAAQP
jgi:purine nucleosidase